MTSPAQRTAVKQRPHQETERWQVATSEPVVHHHGREGGGGGGDEARPTASTACWAALHDRVTGLEVEGQGVSVEILDEHGRSHEGKRPSEDVRAAASPQDVTGECKSRNLHLTMGEQRTSVWTDVDSKTSRVVDLLNPVRRKPGQRETDDEWADGQKPAIVENS
jgi:hypothetical protein